MLSRNTRTNLFKKNSNTFKNLMAVNNIPIDNFRYIFAKFTQQILFIYLHRHPDSLNNFKSMIKTELSGSHLYWGEQASRFLFDTDKYTDNIKKVYNNGKKLLNNN